MPDDRVLADGAVDKLEHGTFLMGHHICRDSRLIRQGRMGQEEIHHNQV